MRMLLGVCLLAALPACASALDNARLDGTVRCQTNLLRPIIDKAEELTGRGIDTPGIELARDYIAVEFAKYGLQPAGDNGSYLQGSNGELTGLDQLTGDADIFAAGLGVARGMVVQADDGRRVVEHGACAQGAGLRVHALDDHIGVVLVGRDDHLAYQIRRRGDGIRTDLHDKVVENAIDAGADAVDVILKEAGTELRATRWTGARRRSPKRRSRG